MKYPLISIIIPSYNRANLIADTLSSVVNQTHKNWEIIIVDDGSTDNTAEMIEPFLSDPRIKYLKRPEDKLPGGNAARNYGYEMSSGEYIKWLDSDDLLQPHCLELQLENLEQNKSEVSFCRSRFFSSNTERNKVIKGDYWHDNFKLSDTLLQDFIFGKIRFSNNDGLWKSNVIGTQPFAENLRNSQEFLMIIKMLSKNLKVSVVNEVGVLVRDHQARMGSKRTYAEFAHNQIYARYLALTYLKNSQSHNRKIELYLLKSMLFYTVKSLKKGEFKHIYSNFKLILDSIYFTKKII
ncbi:glycosyltransferase family 2 protein [Salinimicrobium sp. WS361]|uniref:glycosyltransferase family 2 protein n=1 Tax=Salinimicrobium sp. WS361 TaxID=3425123 RepID=UPI003D701498